MESDEKLNKKIDRGIEEIRGLKMSTGEKEHMLQNIYASPVLSPYAKKSPYWSAVMSFIQKRQAFAYVLPALLMLVLGGGVVGASSKSLPGDALYPIKVKIMEPVRGAVIFSPEKKAQYRLKLSEKRIKEVEVLLVGSDEGNPEKQDRIDEFLGKNVDALEKSLRDVRKSRASNEKKADTEDTGFETQIKKRYEKRKGKVKSIIDETGSKIEINNIENAIKLLEEAEKEEEMGENLRAYTKLLNSEDFLSGGRNKNRDRND